MSAPSHPPERTVVGHVQPRGRNQQIAACHDGDSLWVEIAGPKGGGPWQMTPRIARELAEKLETAASLAETYR